MDEKKQIEEMAKFIWWSCENKSMDYCDKVDDCDICKAIDLYNAGYRNCKDKVVLDQEEWATMHNEYAKALYNARKETAREILSRLHCYGDRDEALRRDLLNLADDYEVEVE